MERLLNIKEAAEFLNVSEMTVRRWTNKGVLKCYRIGGRQARRFKPRDLIDYLEGDPARTDRGLVSIGFNDFKVPDGSHVTHLCSDPHEALQVAADFIMEGLQNHETVCVVAPESESGAVFDVMRGRGAGVDRLRATQKLFFSAGLETPAHQARMLADMAAAAGKDFRVFGDMSWTKVKGWLPEHLQQFEQAVNRWPDISEGMLFLCQYKLARFSGEETMMAIETHSHNIYRGLLRENPYPN